MPTTSIIDNDNLVIYLDPETGQRYVDYVYNTNADAQEKEIISDVQYDEKELNRAIDKILKEQYVFKPKNTTYGSCTYCWNTRIPLDELIIPADIKGQSFCKKCLTHTRARKCSKCGSYYYNSCPCRRKKRTQTLDVLEYNAKEIYKPFKASENDNILIGIELELEFPENDSSSPRDMSWSRYVNDAMKEIKKQEWIYFKRDGSITNGLEIVTQPLGWEWIRNNQDSLSIFEKLIGDGFRSKNTNTCGLHVHISKDLFKTLHLGKFVLFHYNNLPFIQLIAERGWGSISRWARFDSSLSTIIGEIERKHGQERHSLVNLSNPETVECRYYRGSLDLASIMKAIEFTVCLYQYTRETSLAESNKIRNFISYLNNNKKEFPYLWEFLGPVRSKYL